MEVIFDCFFEETFQRLERSGLKSKQVRRDVMDHLNAIISGCCDGIYINIYLSSNIQKKKKNYLM